MNSMRVLLTGSTGFIGRHVLTQLAERQDVQVYAVCTRIPDTSYQIPNTKYHPCDLLDSAAVTALIEAVRPTHVLHFAWIATPGVYQTSPENELWLEASKHLFREAARCGAKRIVGSGSCFEYDWSSGTCKENVTALEPTTLYGRCKRDCGLEFVRLGTESGVSSAWGRIFFLYGPGEPEKKFVASMINSLLKNEDALCTHGRQVRDFLMVEDVASAFVRLLFSEVTGAVNIASGEPVTLAHIAETVGRILGKSERIRLGAREAPAGEPERIVADVTRLRDEVEWVPRHSLDEGVRRSIEWWQEKSVTSG